MASPEIICPMCGAKNASVTKRCESCGARIEALGDALTAEEEAARRYQQQGFVWKWAFISFGVYFVLAAIALVGLRIALSSVYDPQGLPGIVIAVATWFVGGVVVGFVSPGRTFLEPAVGALLAMFPTIGWLIYIDVVAQLSVGAYIISGLIGVMVALMGAFLGERMQIGLRKA